MKVKKVTTLKEKHHECDMMTNNENFFIRVGDTALLIHNSPSVIFGADPREERNGAFFVGTKSVFNKTIPKLAHSHDEIDKLYSNSAVSDKLHAIFDGLEKVFPDTSDAIFQTELLFVPGTKENETIDGKEHITFTPNTITYAVPKDDESDLYEWVKDAEFGIVVNQQYDASPSGYDDKIETSTTRIDHDLVDSMVDNAKSNNIFMMNAYKKNLNAAELDIQIDSLRERLNQMKNLTNEIDEEFDQKWVQDNPVLKAIKKFINRLVRSRSDIIYGKGSYSEFRRELKSFAKNDDKLSGRVTDTILDRLEQYENDLRVYLDIFQRMIIIKYEILEALQDLMGGTLGKTLVKTDNGYEVTDDEGFVVTATSGVAKFVDRIEFSRINFKTTF